jgi:ATP-dependent RNA helicase RhlE
LSAKRRSSYEYESINVDAFRKLISIQIPVVKDHPFVTKDNIIAQEKVTEELKVKAKENKKYRGNKSNGDFWRRKKREK